MVPVVSDSTCYLFCRMSGLWGSCCMTFPGPMWENWYLWWVSGVLAPFSTHSPKKHFPSFFSFNAYFGDDEIQTPPGLWWWTCWLGSWKSLRKTFSSVLPSYLSRASPLELIRDLQSPLCTHVPPLLTCFTCKKRQNFPSLICLCLLVYQFAPFSLKSPGFDVSQC